MIGCAVWQADQRDESRQNAGGDSSRGLRKKERGPDNSPREQDYRGRVHVKRFSFAEVSAAQAAP
jgi:hypothetical protein